MSTGWGERGQGSPASAVPSPVAWAVYVALPLLVMAYTLGKSPLYWAVPRDPTNWDAARFIAHGRFGQVYSPTTALVSFPGLAFLSVPVAALAGLLHLGTLSSGSGHSLRPTAWYLWGPWVSLVGGTIILAGDSVAAHLGVPGRRRAVLALVQAALVWQVVALWGHPEDALAVSLFLWAWLASERGRWAAAGWLLGGAVVVQPVVVLVVPILLVLCPAGRRLGLVVRGAVPSAVLLVPELVTSGGATTSRLLRQPNYPTLDHPTPLLSLAPRLADVGHTEAVAAGPARLVSLALCCLVASAVYRRPQSPVRLVWCFALCFALRSLLESVMDPYYLWSALALAVLAASVNRGLYFALAALASVLMTGYAQTTASPWRWWGPLIAGTVVVLWAAFPVAPSVPGPAVPPEPNGARGSPDGAPSTVTG